jgi:glutamate racemase
VAIELLRARYPGLPIVGVEPGLRPAAAATRNGKIGVLATAATLSGEKFRLLRDQISAASGAHFLLQPCVGLAERIELGEFDSESTMAMLERYIVPLLDQGADTLVLGSTHYPLARASIERVIARATEREVALVETGDAVARQLVRLLSSAGVQRATGSGSVEGFTTAGATALATAFSRLIGICPAVHEVASSRSHAM